MHIKENHAQKGEPAFGWAGPGNLQTRVHSGVVDLKPCNMHLYGIKALSEQPSLTKNKENIFPVTNDIMSSYLLKANAASNF